jgi:hypothetical protein
MTLRVSGRAGMRGGMNASDRLPGTAQPAQVVEARFKLKSATIVDAADRHGHVVEDMRGTALRT